MSAMSTIIPLEKSFLQQTIRLLHHLMLALLLMVSLGGSAILPPEASSGQDSETKSSTVLFEEDKIEQSGFRLKRTGSYRRICNPQASSDCLAQESSCVSALLFPASSIHSCLLSYTQGIRGPPY